MVDLITRAQWGARPPTEPMTQVPWSERVGVAVHYTQGNKTDTPLQLQAYAQDVKGYIDGHYNLLVDYLGNAYEGRGWTVSAAHSEGENFEWIGIAFIGKDADVTPAAEATIAALCADADKLAGRILKRAGHQELPGAQTSCPGPRLMDLVRRLREDDDMTPEQDLRLKRVELTLGSLIQGLDDTIHQPYDDGSSKTFPIIVNRQLKQLVADVAEVKARPAVEPAPVDVAELAAALQPYLGELVRSVVREEIEAVDYTPRRSAQ